MMVRRDLAKHLPLGARRSTRFTESNAAARATYVLPSIPRSRALVSPGDGVVVSSMTPRRRWDSKPVMWLPEVTPGTPILEAPRPASMSPHPSVLALSNRRSRNEQMSTDALRR